MAISTIPRSIMVNPRGWGTTLAFEASGTPVAVVVDGL